MLQRCSVINHQLRELATKYNINIPTLQEDVAERRGKRKGHPAVEQTTAQHSSKRRHTDGQSESSSCIEPPTDSTIGGFTITFGAGWHHDYVIIVDKDTGEKRLFHAMRTWGSHGDDKDETDAAKEDDLEDDDQEPEMSAERRAELAEMEKEHFS